MKFDGQYEGGIGYGATEEEAIRDTLKNFFEIIEKNYPDRDKNGLNEDEIRFKESCEF